jgi:hypothetical protein
MGKLAKAVLLLIIIGVALWYFLQQPESEPYKLTSSITVSYPNTVVADEYFKVNATLSYTVPSNVPSEIMKYIQQYGDSYIIGDKELKLEKSTGEIVRTSITNSYGAASFYVRLNSTSTLKVVFEGSSLLKKCESTQFTISVSENPTVQIVLSSNMLDSYVGESSTMTVTLNSIGGYQGDVSLEVLNVPSGVTVNIVPQTLTVSASTQCNVTFQVSNSAVTGTYTLTLNVKDSTGSIISSSTFTLNIKQYELLSASISVSKTAIELGESVTIYSSATGGKTPYTFSHYINDTYYTNVQNYNYTPQLIGIYLFRVQVIDAKGTTANSQTVTVKVAKFDALIYIYNMSSILDFNGDGVICDDADYQEFLKHYPSKRGDSNYDSKYDINEDGYINVKDMTILGSNAGSVFFTVYIDNEELYSGILKRETIYVGKYISGVHTISVSVVTGESGSKTLELVSGSNYVCLVLNNPWKTRGLKLLFLTGNFVVDALRVLSLVIVVICTILLVILLKRKE